MATFVVETGEGLADANAYCDVAFATAYLDCFGSPAVWTGATSATKQNALREATRYLDSNFGTRWVGTRANENQALDWPRWGAIASSGFPIGEDVVPTTVGQVCAVGALLHLQGELLNPAAVDAGDVASESFTVGPITDSATYVGSKSATTTFPLIERMLRSARLITGGGGWGIATR